MRRSPFAATRKNSTTIAKPSSHQPFEPISKQRREHLDYNIHRAERQIADFEGRPSRPYCVIDKLFALELGDVITAKQRMAGNTFYRLFRRAHLDYLHASDPGRTPISGMLISEVAESVDKAQKELARQIRTLGGYGSYAGSCAWHVLGLEMVLKEWATSRAWNIGSMNEKDARGVLITTLDLLAADDSANRQDLDFNFLALTKLRV